MIGDLNALVNLKSVIYNKPIRNLNSLIDYVIYRKRRQITIEDVRVFREVTHGSDHFLIKTKIYFPIPPNSPSASNAVTNVEQNFYTTYNLNTLAGYCIKYLYQRRLDEKLLYV